MGKRSVLCGVCVAAIMALIPASVASAGSVKLSVQAAGSGGDGTISHAAAKAKRQGYLVPNDAAYARQKAAAAAAAPANRHVFDVHAPLAPTAARSFNGIRQPNSAPSDSTGAVGPTRYIELVNTNFAIYSKTSNTPMSTGSLNTLANEPNDLFDPQVIWDPGTKRFYYAMDDVASATDNRLAFGFSKSGSPSTGGSADWCQYILNYGATFPDYPKLGDTKDFVTIGVNDFNTGGSFVGSDIAWISKPGAGTACPSPATFHAGAEQGLQTPGGGTALTPVGVNQTDTSATGYAVSVNTNPSTKITLFKVTKNASGDAVIANPGTQVTVPSYSAPPNIPQQGTTNQLDSLDRRLTQAVSGIDPGHANKVGIWTQHTVSGGAGAQVRWYEIDPVGKTLLQSGKVTSASLYNFNGAISPNRAVNGTVKSGGDSMVLGFDTSSSTTKPAVKMVSKIGAGAQSAPVLLKNSPSSYQGFDCPPNPCRWGDYAGASPDPTPPAGTSRVWQTSQYAINNGNPTGASGWGTWNWAANP